MVRYACQDAGVGRKTVYDRKANDDEFARRWDEAMEEAVDELEKEARKRAIGMSDTLLIFMLKSRRRVVFGEKMSVDQTSRVIFVDEAVSTQEKSDIAKAGVGAFADE